MRDDAYFRSPACLPGSHRPSVQEAQAERRALVPPSKPLRRDPVDVTLKIFGGLCVWAIVFVVLWTIYEGLILLMRRH